MRNKEMSRWKWIYVQMRGGLGFAMVSVPLDLTVSQFKLLLGADPRSLVTVRSAFRPLAENEALYGRVSNYDTVYIEPCRRTLVAS
jgi:hypothetical protein